MCLHPLESYPELVLPLPACSKGSPQHAHSLELFDQRLVQLVAEVLHCAALAVHDHRVVEVGQLALRLGIHAHLHERHQVHNLCFRGVVTRGSGHRLDALWDSAEVRWQGLVHVCEHGRTSVHAHEHELTRVRACTPTPTHALTHTHAHTHTRTHTHTHAHVFAHVHTHVHQDLGEAWTEARCAPFHLDVGFWIHMDVWKD